MHVIELFYRLHQLPSFPLFPPGRDLSSVLQEVLGVEAVWCDTRTEDSSQQFVLWAGVVLEQRHTFRASLQARGGRAAKGCCEGLGFVEQVACWTLLGLGKATARAAH